MLPEITQLRIMILNDEALGKASAKIKKQLTGLQRDLEQNGNDSPGRLRQIRTLITYDSFMRECSILRVVDTALKMTRLGPNK